MEKIDLKRNRRMETGQAILKAVRECDELGQEAFLEKYGFRHARRYFLEYEGRLYDSKAIVGVARRYEFPEKGPRHPADFSGGATVQRKLEKLKLDFKVRVLPK